MTSRTSWGTILAALLALGVAASARAEPLKVRIAWVVVPSNLTPILFPKPGIARHNGISYEIDAVHFTSTPQMTTALATDEIDIAGLSYSAYAIAIQNAGMDDLRVVSDDFQDGVEGYFTDRYMVLRDSPIRTVEDLKGKVLASNGAGSAIDMGLRAMLRRHGLEDKKDVTIIDVALPNMKAALAERKVDLISAIALVAHDSALDAMARTLFTQKEAIGTTEMVLWAGRAGFLQKNHAALVDLMEDVLRSRRYYMDPANHKEAVAIVSQFLKAPPERFDPWLFVKGKDYFRDPEGRPDLGALQANIETQRDLGFLKAGFDVRSHADLSLVDEAASRLK